MDSADLHNMLFEQMNAKKLAPNRAKREAKTWVRKHGVYRCGNCGKHPIYVNIREMSQCPYCEMKMGFYQDTSKHLKPLWTEKQLRERQKRVS